MPETVILYLKHNYQIRLHNLLKSVETGFDILKAGIKSSEDLIIDESLISDSHKKLIQSFNVLKEHWARKEINSSSNERKQCVCRKNALLFCILPTVERFLMEIGGFYAKIRV